MNRSKSQIGWFNTDDDWTAHLFCIVQQSLSDLEVRQNMVDSDVFLTRHGARIDKEDRHSKRASEFCTSPIFSPKIKPRNPGKSKTWGQKRLNHWPSPTTSSSGFSQALAFEGGTPSQGRPAAVARRALGSCGAGGQVSPAAPREARAPGRSGKVFMLVPFFCVQKHRNPNLG